MPVFRVIPAGDIAMTYDPTTGKRQLRLVGGVRYVRQKIASRLKFFLGEWFLDQRQGVPYYRDVFVQNPDLDLIRSVFRAVIVSVQEVTDVLNLEVAYSQSTRELAVSFEARLVAGGVLLVRQPDEPFIIRVQRVGRSAA